MSTVELDLEFIRQTSEAYLVTDGDVKDWLPKSETDVDFSDILLEDGQVYLFTIPEWLAENKGFV